MTDLTKRAGEHHPECSSQQGSAWCDCKGLPFRVDGRDTYDFVCMKRDLAPDQEER